MFLQCVRAVARSLISLVLIVAAVFGVALGQNASPQMGIVPRETAPKPVASGEPRTVLTPEPLPKEGSAAAQYFDPQGASSSDLVRRALAGNAELAAARLDIERARARLLQAGLRPNPTVDFEHTTGRFTGSPGERNTTLGLALPLELGGKRQRRIELARAELEAAEAEVADRERRLATEVRTAYAEALSAVRELTITDQLNNVDVQTARIVEVRVTEGESAQLELNLMRAEVDRSRSRRALVQGRLEGALLKLKSRAGIPPAELLRLREDLASPILLEPSVSVEQAVDVALRMRPDVRLARLTEEAAQARLRLARAEGIPDVSLFTKYSLDRSIFDDTPVGAIKDTDRSLSFGVSIGIPVFNRNQGAKAEAATAISQAQRRREFIEQLVRAEVASAYSRYEAAQAALAIFEQGVLARSSQNVSTIREAYRLGAFRVTELLAEQRRLMDSQREFTETLTERYRALVDLYSAVGIIDPERGIR